VRLGYSFFRMIVAFRTLALVIVTFSAIASGGYAQDSDICRKTFSSNSAWLKLDKRECLLVCMTSQHVTLANFDCPRVMCKNFCEKAGSIAQPGIIQTRGCEEIRNPSTWEKLRRMPKNPFKAFPARRMAFSAVRRAQELFPPQEVGNLICYPVHNGKGDAFRHCLWSCEMAKEFGP
jgi:hypothetical protein